MFNEYICDSRYGWAAACEEVFGTGVHAVAIFHQWNTEAETGGDQRTLVAYRDVLCLQAALVPHSLRQSYVTHLVKGH